MLKFQKVMKIMGKSAIMDDHRKVSLGDLTGIKPGDWLEVFAGLAVSKTKVTEVKAVNRTRKGNIL